MERKVDLRNPGRVGSYLGVEEKAALALACAIHRSESDDTSLSASWSAQERAQDFANTHELSEVLDEVLRLDPNGLD